MVETILLTVTRLTTLRGQTILSNATGFFFERDGQLWLITNRHVVLDEPSQHRPDALDLEIHSDPENLAAVTQVRVPLYEGAAGRWREAIDAAGVIDVVALPIAPEELPPQAVYRAFTPEHLVVKLEEVEVGTRLLVVGFPLGFHDTLHRLPVVRQAVIASAFGLRFQGTGCFLTDGRTHRGISGAPVVSRVSKRPGRKVLAFSLLGVHASRIDVGTRDLQQDESLGLNCAWYADALLTLTAPPAEPPEQPEAPVEIAGT